MRTRFVALLTMVVLAASLSPIASAQNVPDTPPVAETPITPVPPLIATPLIDDSEETPAVAEPIAQQEKPLTRPTLVDAAKLNPGDTAWMLTSTALVLLMTIPGLALFYAGMVRKKNVLATMAQSFAVTCLVTVLWVVIGYSLAFTPGSPYIGGLDRVLLDGMAFMKEAGKVTVSEIAPTIPESVFVMFQMTFAIITPALITGAFAERMKFSALLIFMALWSVFVYAPVAHWVWEPGGWLAGRGVLDFAGGTVVHINAGISGLIAAVIIGPRTGFGREPMPPHNLVLTVIGACLLWVGWFGFNAGSAVAADGRAGMAMLVTQLATAVAALAWMFAEWLRRGKPSVLGMVSGAVSGLVAITPASGFVGISGALAIGAAAGVACYWGATSLKSMFGYDDSLDVFGVHAIGGIVGALLTGVFAVKEIGGAESSFGNQAFGVIVTIAFSAVMTAIILGIVKALVGLRVTEEAERDGLDLEQHGEHVL
ncbi:ammonium transporter [Oxalicibacterium solurbis]|uniref:Ammonium transporter n=1 Tax=Oxalicibacterium solurbis TaxID=69280 RepID=A0A8J3AUP6_9BURK|nr:ammonium transporter [Oxalicibacterium solurbis]GGI53979.1 ammonium transporter [Oxalicibacterium solurbis]